jgi:Holliday junction resolvase RusA-like endonuclease
LVVAKPRQKLSFRLPPYRSPRNEWRKCIYRATAAATKKQKVTYPADAKLAVDIVLYLSGRALEVHDVDNRLKDVLDALQGRMGGSKAIRRFKPLIGNDRQIYRVTITKSSAPSQSRGLGHVCITGAR